MIKGGVRTHYAMEVRNKETGKLVYAESTNTRHYVLYDRWRCWWCNRHRTKHVPAHIRTGSKVDIGFMILHLI